MLVRPSGESMLKRVATACASIAESPPYVCSLKLAEDGDDRQTRLIRAVGRRRYTGSWGPESTPLCLLDPVISSDGMSCCSDWVGLPRAFHKP